uniref:Uncharacterized protein n=1 Tax=Arion vulgaris TaxID=1028688 RepID=A0A0B7B7M1_9EUPU
MFTAGKFSTNFRTDVEALNAVARMILQHERNACKSSAFDRGIVIYLSTEI